MKTVHGLCHDITLYRQLTDRIKVKAHWIMQGWIPSGGNEISYQGHQMDCCGTLSSWGVEFHILLTANREHYHESRLNPSASEGSFSLICFFNLKPLWWYVGRMMRYELQALSLSPRHFMLSSYQVINPLVFFFISLSFFFHCGCLLFQLVPLPSMHTDSYATCMVTLKMANYE